MNEDIRFIIRLLFAVLFISLLSAGVGMKLQKKATDRWYAEHQEPYCGPFGITSAMKVGDIYFCAASSQWKQEPSHVEIIDLMVDECALPKGCKSETIPVKGKLNLLHKLAPGEEVPPKPVREVTYNCPEGWEASGAWNRETGVPLKSKPGLYTVHPLSCVRVSEDDPKEMINRLEKEGGHIDLTNSHFWSTDPTVPSSVTIGPGPGWVTTGKCDPKTGLPSCLIDHDAK